MIKTSKVWLIDKDKLQNLLDNSDSFSDVMRQLGYTNVEGNIRTLKDRIQKDSLSLLNLNKNRLLKLKSNNLSNKEKLLNEEIFIENSKISRQCVKERILKNKLIDYKCRDCDNTGTWNNKPLSLHLEHKNGINNDNRLENLCFLCANCHSQTTTYAGKNNKINETVKVCEGCGAEVSKHNTNGLCFTCASNKKCKVHIGKEELEQMLPVLPVSEIAKKYNLTDNAIRKKARKLGLRHLLKPRGYWSKR